jgi:hypothetical protein
MEVIATINQEFSRTLSAKPSACAGNQPLYVLLVVTVELNEGMLKNCIKHVKSESGRSDAWVATLERSYNAMRR